MSRDAVSGRPSVLGDGIVVVISVVLQMTLAGQLNFFGAVPNFLLCAVFFVAVRHTSTAGGVCGFVLGLLFDLLGANTVGLSALIATLFGFFAAVFASSVNTASVRQSAVLFLGLSFVYNLLYFTMLLLISEVASVGFAALARVVVSVILDSVYAVLVLLCAKRLSGRGSDSLKL